MSTPSRVIGMRKNPNVRPLLRTVGGRSTGGEMPEPRATDSKMQGSDRPADGPAARVTRKTKSSAAEPLPAAVSDNQRVRSLLAFDAEPMSSSSSEDDGRSRRADIKSTTFQSGSTAGPAQSKKPAARKPPATRNGKRTRSSTLDIASDSPTPSSSKRSPSPDSHDIDSPPAPRRPKKLKEETSGDDEPQGRFGAMTDAFRRPRAKPAARYGSKRPSTKPTKAGSSQSGSSQAGFKPVGESVVSSPEKDRRFVNYNLGALGDSPFTSPNRAMKIPERVAEDVSDPSPLRRRPKTPSIIRAPRNRGRVKKPVRREISPEQGSPMAVFKMPSSGILDLDTSFDVGPDGGGGDVEDAILLAREDDTASPVDAVCPMCNERVDQELLDNFTKDNRMTIAQQQKFCQHHTLKSARDTWADKGYPDIDWHGLESRISKHHGILQAILEGGPSHYADDFASKVEAGKSKTLLKTKQSLTPGYYGIRGLRLMTESIIKHFSSLLRKRAVEDRLVSARGHTAYVQSVLVPELTVRLIMEDMHVPEETARSTLQASIWIGELLNEEDSDVVPNEDGSDTDPLSSLSSMSDDEVIELE